MTANVYTVPAGEPFLDAVAAAILAGNLPVEGGAAPDLLNLSDITLLLPTRRAARAAQAAFLSASGRDALLLPRIRPIAEGDEDSSLISQLAADVSADALDLKPAISPLSRILVLMQLVERWRAQSAAGEFDSVDASTPAQAAGLASELASLMDDVEREAVSLAKIGGIVPTDYSEHWQKTVDFLKIVTEFWPQYLAVTGQTSPAERRNALIRAEAERIARLDDTSIVIVAGVTGSIPATVDLMSAVARRARGAIVLPALDQSLDDDSWRAIVPNHPEHPQFGLSKLIDALGVARRDVKRLAGVRIDRAAEVRGAFISEALRPASTTAGWHSYASSANRANIAQGLKGVSSIVAPTAQDEAEAIALILRDAVETPGRTAALVSPDRLLARRVAVRLAALGIRVDDSAGRPFAKTIPGTFLNLVIDVIVSDFAPAETMALLKHPLLRVGLQPFDVRRFARALEISAFRATYLGRGSDGIIAALDNSEQMRADGERLHSAAKRLWNEDCEGARDLAMRLRAAFEPLSSLYAKRRKLPLADFARTHADAAERLAALPVQDGAAEGSLSSPLWQGEAGAAAAAFFESIVTDGSPPVEISPADYADLYRALLARENVRERTPVHPRISIWGPYEARLQQPDILVLGSLNEGTWPEAAESGAWLNRSMRRDLGLPAPEEEIGRSAHDFMSLTGAKTVYLTRAAKVNGVPTVPSRWLMRIDALLGGLGLKDALATDRPWLAWARARDRIDPARRVRITAPQPAPDDLLRPRQLSVTAIESWIANPYAIFARHILKLERLPELGASPDQSLRGSLVHEVLAKFAKAYPDALPENIEAELQKIARDVLKAYTGHARIAAFWMPRLERFLSWFADSERERRAGIEKVVAEASSNLVVEAPGGPFRLTARADRIDDDGRSIVITDYKTGQAPNKKQVEGGRAPQLPLEAAIALGQTGFAGLSGRGVSKLRYIRASGGEPAGDSKDVAQDNVAELAAAARRGLEQLVADFDKRETPYRAVRRPGYRYDYDDFAQLARVAEWSAHVDDEGAT